MRRREKGRIVLVSLNIEKEEKLMGRAVAAVMLSKLVRMLVIDGREDND